MKQKKTMPKKLKIRIAFFVLSFLIPLNFYWAFLTTVPVTKEECKSIIVTYEYCKNIYNFRALDEFHLYFSDGESYFVDEYCLKNGLQQELEALEKGTEMELYVDEVHRIVEINLPEREIFTYEQYSERTMELKKGILIAFYFALVIVPSINLYELIKEKNKFK